MSIYDFTVPKPNGEKLSLADFKEKVILIVNTATGCGFTPQYKDLEKLYEKYHDKGLEIIDIPCNQFGHQTPGSDEEVHQFCQLHFKTQFPQMKKSDVNGKNELPLYTYLKSCQGFKGFGRHKLVAILSQMLAEKDPDWDKKSDIKWNFTKFLVDKNGKVISRFAPTVTPESIESKIKEIL